MATDAFGNYRPGPATLPDTGPRPIKMLQGNGAPARTPDHHEVAYEDLTNRPNGFYHNTNQAGTWVGPNSTVPT